MIARSTDALVGVSLHQFDLYDRVLIISFLGVVRGVDLDSNELFLITPESSDTLELLTHLIYGSVNLPPSVYMTADDVNGVIPYVSLGTLASFSSIPKRTHLPKMTKKR